MNTNINGYDTFYIDEGAGEPILFLHGWGSSTDAFARMVIPLKERLRCIRVDLPGFGRSAMLKEPFTLDDYCDFVKAFIDKLGLKDPIMVGHSNGGRITLKMCAEGMVSPEKIVLFGSAGIRSERTRKQKFRTFTFKTIKRALTLPIVRNYSEEALERARRHFGSADYRALTPFMRQTFNRVIGQDLTPCLAKIKAPTLLVWGENDTATPLWMGQLMEKEIPDAGLVVLKGCGHFAYLDKYGEFRLIAESFLK